MTPSSIDKVKAAVYANSFKDFVKAFWPFVSNDQFKGGYLVDALCEHLQALHKGDITRLAVACPIRHGKSLFCSVLFPTWVWITDPTIRIISASCGEDLAERDSVRTRNLITCPLYRKLFGHVFQLSQDQNQKHHYQNDRGGFRKAVGVQTQTTGADADYILVDDLIDYKRARSDAERLAALDFYNTVLSKRIVHGTGKDRILIAGHRVHEEDLFAEIRNIYGDDGGFTYLVLPSEARPDYTNSLFNGLGWKDTRKEGEPLCPERFDEIVIAHEKRSLRHEYYCLYQQDPSPAIGDQFKNDWFRYWYPTDDGGYELNGAKYTKQNVWRFGTIDTAVSEKTGADWTVCQIWDVVGDKLVLVHQLRKRLNGVMIVPTLHEIYKTYSPQFLSIEKEFVGQFVIDQLRALNVVVKPFQAKKYGPKEVRAVSAEIRLEAGKVYFPKADWVADLEREILTFPNGAHDDQVDALSQACLLADKFLGNVEPDLTPGELAEKNKRDRAQWFERAMNAGSPF